MRIKLRIKPEILSTFLSAFLNVWAKSCRWKRYNYNPEITPAIYAIWHGMQNNLGAIENRKNLHILISQSNDGEIIAQTVKKSGFSTVRGSMKRGGVKATMEIIRALKEGKNIAYTVDGPKGPGFKVKPGIVKIAQLSQKPVIPVNSAASWEIELPSWDKYQIPFFFSKLVWVCGDPIYIPAELTDKEAEDYRLKIEQELFSLRELAKRLIK